MQDGWGGGEDMGLSAGQWEQDEGDMWNSTASQESNSSWGNPPKKGPPKVKKKKKYLLTFNVGVMLELIFLCFSLKGKVPNKQDDTWIMNRLIKQLTDMGFPVSTAYLS